MSEKSGFLIVFTLLVILFWPLAALLCLLIAIVELTDHMHGHVIKIQTIGFVSTFVIFLTVLISYSFSENESIHGCDKTLEQNLDQSSRILKPLVLITQIGCELEGNKIFKKDIIAAEEDFKTNLDISSLWVCEQTLNQACAVLSKNREPLNFKLLGISKFKQNATAINMPRQIFHPIKDYLLKSKKEEERELKRITKDQEDLKLSICTRTLQENYLNNTGVKMTISDSSVITGPCEIPGKSNTCKEYKNLMKQVIKDKRELARSQSKKKQRSAFLTYYFAKTCQTQLSLPEESLYDYNLY